MDTYTVKEVAKMMNTSEETVRRWIRSGKLKANMNSRKKGSVITDAMLREFTKNTPKYAAALTTPIGGIVAASTLLLGTLVAKNVEKGEAIKNSTIDSEEIKKILKEKLPKIYSKDLLELLFFEFYTKNEYIRTKLNISRQTATSYLKQLEKVGILSSEKVGKEIIYKNISLFKIAEN